MSQSVENNLAALAALALPARAIINGAMRDAEGGATFPNVTPRDGSVLNHVAACSAADVDAAVASARAAFEDKRWRGLHPRKMKAILFRLADLMQRDAEALALMEAIDTGKPIREARAGDIAGSIQCVRWYAEALDKVYGEVGASPPDRLSIAVNEPLGVIAAIVPWNFPLLMAVWKVAPALATGNSVVLKPAEQSPLTALHLGALALEAGVPPGALNIVPGLGETTGKALALHMDVDMVAFTGSGPVGKLLMQYAGQSNLKRVSLELGGKSPQIIFADCPDFDTAAQHAAWAIFYNQGEVCTAGSRLLVERSVQDQFLERVVAVAKSIPVGDPMDDDTVFGAMVSEEQMNRVLRYIEIATVEKGRLVTGGNRVRGQSGGFYIEPTIFEGITPDMTIAKEEIFGPVLGVIPFDTEEEALRIANGTDYGLAAGVWTANTSRALRMARDIRSGLVWVNGWDSDDIVMPFGGFKQSGFGRDRSLHALHKYCDLKTISVTM